MNGLVDVFYLTSPSTPAFNCDINFSFRCAVDSFVFPELGLSRSGDSLEARFNAFKIPESNFLVFEATVKTCREGCQPVRISLIYINT